MAELHRMDNDLIQRASRNSFMLVHKFQTTTPRETTFEARSVPTDIRWEAEFDLSRLPLELTRRFQAFFDRVMQRGQYFSLFDPVHQYPRGCPHAYFQEDVSTDNLTSSDNLGFAEAQARVEGDTNNRGDAAVLVSGMLPNANVLMEGDRFSIEHGIAPACAEITYEVAQPAYTDASGIAEIRLTNGLRSNLAGGEFVNFIRPRTPMQFINDYSADRGNRQLVDVSFRAREVYEILDEEEILLL